MNPNDEEKNTHTNTEHSNQEAYPSEGMTKKAAKVSKKMLVLCGALALIVVAGLTYVLVNDPPKSISQVNETKNTTTEDQPKATQIAPFTLAYAQTDITSAKNGLFWVSANGGTPHEVEPIAKNNYISESAVRGAQAAVVTEAAYGSTDGTTIQYSKDGGKKYKKIYEATAKSTESAIGTQITSMVFSTDGKTLAVAILPEGNEGNRVTEINLNTGDSKVLFTDKQRGIFLQGYDVATKKVLYFKGCFNCDANTYTELLTQDLAAKTETTLLTTPTWAKVAVNRDFTRLVAFYGQKDPNQPEGLGESVVAPFVVKEINLTDSSQKDIATSDESISAVGYTDDTQAPYYVTDKKVIFANDNKTLLFESSKPILDVLYITGIGTITSSGTYDNYTVNKFTLTKNITTQLLSGTSSTRLFGITQQ